MNADQIEDLSQLYQLSWWGKGREVKDIRTMLDNSDVNLGICHKQTQKLVGFTRVLTDFIYRAAKYRTKIVNTLETHGV